ncbi:MAG TPA: class I SAM-dependent methyltransferase, partial [Nitrospirota bacterium]
MGYIEPAAYGSWYLTPFGAQCHRLERDALFSLAWFNSGERVLDAGCGTGIYLEELRRIGIKAVGLDRDRAMLDFAAKKSPGSMLVEGHLVPLPFRSLFFDKVLCVCALEFVPEPEKAVREMVRVLKPGGVLLMGFLNSNSAWAELRLKKAKEPSSVWHGVRFYTLAEITGLAEKCGLKAGAFRGAVH